MNLIETGVTYISAINKVSYFSSTSSAEHLQFPGHLQGGRRTGWWLLSKRARLLWRSWGSWRRSCWWGRWWTAPTCSTRPWMRIWSYMKIYKITGVWCFLEMKIHLALHTCYLSQMQWYFRGRNCTWILVQKMVHFKGEYLSWFLCVDSTLWRRNDKYVEVKYKSREIPNQCNVQGSKASFDNSPVSFVLCISEQHDQLGLD